MRALAEEGLELLENGGQYLLKYGEDIIPLGDLKTAARELNAIFNRGRKVEAKTALDEWIAKVKLRQEVLAKWISKFEISFTF